MTNDATTLAAEHSAICQISGTVGDEPLNAYLSQASFWAPDYLVESAWSGHAPFAFWICGVCRPRRFVELGTHSGFSYFAFCQAVKLLELEAECFAVDTWRGDEHSGFYGEDVLRLVKEQNDAKYSGFSTLIRGTFDEALERFEDGSVDLLHIDGRHFYEDVRHDFESWRRKLSDGAVVLFHDTNVRQRGFGVFRFWAEISKEHQSFEFFHSHGLGVLVHGRNRQGHCKVLRSCPAAECSLPGSNDLRSPRLKNRSGDTPSTTTRTYRGVGSKRQ